MGMSNRPAPVPYNAAEYCEYLVGMRDTMKQILAEMDPTDSLYLRAIERLFIAENMVTNHMLSQLLEDMNNQITKHVGCQ